MEYVKEETLKEFIRRLPELQINPPTCHLIMLAVRSRKAKEILGFKVHDLVVEREIVRPITDWRDRYFNSVYNLSVLQHNGRYEYKGTVIPKQAMGIFATLSPRNVISSTADIMKDNITLLPMKDDASKVELAKLPSRYFGALHKHKDRSTNFVTLDLDNDDKKIYQEILDECSTFKIFIATETGRGFHIVLDLTASEDAKKFYGQNQLRQRLGLKYKDLEFQQNSQEPVPGTLYTKKGGIIHYVKILK